LDRNGFKKSESEFDANKMNPFLSISIHFHLLGIFLTISNESDISNSSSESNDTIDNEDKYEVSINSELQTLHVLSIIDQTCIASYRKCVNCEINK